MERLEEHPLLHAGHLAEALEVPVAQDRVADGPERREDQVDEAGSPAGGAHVRRPRVEVDQVVDDRSRRPDRLAPGVRGVPDQLVGVLAVRQARDAHLVELHPGVRGGKLAGEPLQRRDAQRARALTRRVHVVGQHDLLGRVARQERHLARRQRGAEAGDHVLEAGLVGHERVRVALHDHRDPGLADGGLRAVQRIERPALVEQRGGGRVEVLGTVGVRDRAGRAPRPGRGLCAVRELGGLSGGLGGAHRRRTGCGVTCPRRLRRGSRRRGRSWEDAAAEAGRVAGGVPDREEHPAPEAVVDTPAALAGRGEARLDQLGRADLALALQGPDQGIPVRRREAELGALDRLVGEATAAEVGKRRRARLAVEEDRVVEGERRVQHVVEALAMGILARRPLVDLHPGALGQPPERLRERDPIPAHDERKDVTALATAEAMPGFAPGRHDEARRLLPVERAETLERRAGLLELDRLADDVDDGQLALDFRSDPDGQPASSNADGDAQLGPCQRAPCAGHRNGVSSLDTPVFRADDAPGPRGLSRGLSIPLGSTGQGARMMQHVGAEARSSRPGAGASRP